jgi:hypothetical protein
LVSWVGMGGAAGRVWDEAMGGMVGQRWRAADSRMDQSEPRATMLVANLPMVTDLPVWGREPGRIAASILVAPGR